jgi:hypothetical protein
MKRAILVCLVLLVAATQVVRPGAELVLSDGRVIEGVDVRREGQNYVLELESGERLTFPVALVEEVRLTGDEKEKQNQLRPGFRNAGQETLSGALPDDDAPTGLREAEPQTLAGREVRPPRPSEQTDALGPAAEFQKSIIDNEWRPETDWNMDPHEQNNFNPSEWAKGPVDPNWTPESAFDANKDVMESSRSEFQEGVVDNSWEPTDGFQKRNDDFWGSS